MLRRSGRRCTCHLAARKLLAMVIAKRARRFWMFFLSGNQFMSTIAASFSALRSTSLKAWHKENKSEGRGQKAEVRGQKTEVGDQISDNGGRAIWIRFGAHDISR